MRWFLTLAATVPLLALQAQPSPQTPSAPAVRPQPGPEQSCRDEGSVDEYLAEMNKAKKQRNKNPLPNSVCLGGWCKGSGAGKPDPRQLPTSHPPQTTGGEKTGESSSQEATEQAAVYDPIAAAQSVEVGDYYFSEKKYRAALSRYQEALKSKPDDAAIYLRLGRAFDKLDEATRALESYDASLVADPAGPSADEARKSAERLRPEVEKRGDDPGAISARNRARVVPRCRTGTAAPGAVSNPPR